MPVVPALSYPGVYIQEIPSEVRTITGVATSITAFIGRALRGPLSEPVRVQSFGEFERTFGGLWAESTLGYAVVQFFLNGGGDALVVRVASPFPKPATLTISALKLVAADPGAQGNSLKAKIEDASNGNANLFKLTISKPPAKDVILDNLAIANIDTALASTPVRRDPTTPAPGRRPDNAPETNFSGGADGITVSTLTIGVSAELTISGLKLVAANPGALGNSLKAKIEDAGNGDANLFKLTISQPPDVVLDNLAIANIDTALASTPVRRDPTTPAPGSRPANAEQKNFSGGEDRTTAASGKSATLTISGLKLVAANPGAQGNSLKAKIEDATKADSNLFKLTISQPPDVVLDNLAITNIDTALASTSVRRDPTTPAPGNRPANAAQANFSGGEDGGLGLVAANPGNWGQKLRVRIEHPPGSDNTIFNLIVRDSVNGGTGVTERFLNVSTVPAAARYVKRVLKQQSNLVGATAVPATRPTASGNPPASRDPLEDNASSTAFNADGSDGVALTDTDISDPSMEESKQGLWALQKADLFNLLCIPPLTHDGDLGAQTRNSAAAYCEKRRALFVVDPLRGWATHAAAITGVDDTTNFMSARNKNAALFFPLVRSPDPRRDGQLTEFAPCGIVAGVMARTDGTRGVWKAPAGTDATLNGVSELTVKLTDGENGQLNPLGINCLRSFPVIGQVVWGSRTLFGADQLANEWKYIPVRRTALYIEESLYRGTKWVVFEPNDEPLWAQIRLNIGAFMQNLFRQGAFQGKTPREAYFVKCDKETTTQNDINLGIVNIIVGFAPLKPAEFVVIYLQQMAGQIQT